MTFRPGGAAAAFPRPIPDEAAGRDDLFLFGTLMHDAVLAAVLDRPLGIGDLRPARLPGFRREIVVGASYPALVAASGAIVEGRLLHRPSLRDIRRINHYESEEYLAELVEIETVGGMGSAWAYTALTGMRPSGRLWTLEAWAAAHLDGFLGEIERWMADSPW